MPVVNKPGSQPPATPVPSTPNHGAWQQHSDGSWAWAWNAAPDPNLVGQWGYEAVTDIRRDPTGHANHGSWSPVHGGGWTWQWGVDPDPNLVKTYGHDKLTNPDRTPHGADPGGLTHPPPPDVNPPTIADSWNGVAPDITGAVPKPPDDGSQPPPVDRPPHHSAYLVSPGSIRNGENVLLAQIDAQIGDYTSLKNYVAASHQQNIFSDGATREDLINRQDQLLLQIADAVELAGQFTRMLNNAAQSYARADIDSFLPQS
jgi:hypothetical protein